MADERQRNSGEIDSGASKLSTKRTGIAGIAGTDEAGSWNERNISTGGIFQKWRELLGERARERLEEMRKKEGEKYEGERARSRGVEGLKKKESRGEVGEARGRAVRGKSKNLGGPSELEKGREDARRARELGGFEDGRARDKSPRG
ncbi:hypothetical protein KM043_009697 [Ampulex compressa]|nr:hypothetical protein KM043_009697 [Ampulex compressa]